MFLALFAFIGYLLTKSVTGNKRKKIIALRAVEWLKTENTVEVWHYENTGIKRKNYTRLLMSLLIKHWSQLIFLCLCLQDFVEPIYFYIGAVFGLQAVYVTALFVCSWVMSGTWVAGMLAVAWYVINRWEEFCHTVHTSYFNVKFVCVSLYFFLSSK